MHNTTVQSKRESFHPPHSIPSLYRSNKPFDESENIISSDFLRFKGSHILLVEDNIINQKIIQNLLKKSGIQITIANDGQEALDILPTLKPVLDLILMDISMPVMDGYEATKQIRKNTDYDPIPIVTFTAYTQGGEIKKMFSLGANSHITKPLNIGQLYTVFLTYLTHKHREISFLEELKINGLDVKYGIALANNDENAYKKALFDFVVDYKIAIHSIPRWIDKKQSKRIMETCSKMGIALKRIGAYELEDIVFRMKKIYIYNTEHRIEEFREQFPLKLTKLVSNIETYLIS
jgi:CheY-like chemotaxis protein